MAQPMETEDSYQYACDTNTNKIHTMELGTMVEVRVQKKRLYGVLKWLGTDERIGKETIVGLELEDDLPINYKEIGCTDGTYVGKKYFHSKNERAFFAKLNVCKPDSRFVEKPRQQNFQKERGWQSSSTHTMVTYHAPGDAPTSIEGYILPIIPVDRPHKYIGERGIQGHHNSCYMDSTLFAMFSYSNVFDVALHRKRRKSDIDEYQNIQGILRRKIVNPLRENGYVHHASVLELRKHLDSHTNIGGFMTEEKDPEEFVVLLFDKVLKVDPFIKLTMVGSEYKDVSHLYQIFAEKDERHALPTIQYLVEYSFLTCDLQLAEIPSVMILQMPRFGQQKLYKRIQIKSELDISHLLADVRHYCYVCGKTADGYCKECACNLDIETVYTYFCNECYKVFHKHPNRSDHKKTEFKMYKVNEKMATAQVNKLDRTSDTICKYEPVIMELFSVVCIEKSHYVSFVKSQLDDNGSWLFFDSMSDRVGGEDGYNIPKVTKVGEIGNLLSGNPSKILSLDKKKDEQVLRLFQDASLCFYRYRDLSMYR